MADAQKKKREDITQTLPELKDPPAAITAETGRLVFHVTPLSAKGLLSAQVREARKILVHDSKSASVVKLRAFVSGSGDMRRVPSIVSEVFTERKLPLPAVSTVQVGALPMEGAQVILESIALDKKIVNPSGLAFFSGQQGKDVAQSVAQLQTAVSTAGVKPASVLRVTCFLSSLEMLQAARTAITGAFPAAVTNYVQPQRLALEPLVECEAVGRLEKPPASRVEFLNPAGLTQSPNYTQIVLVNAPTLVFSGIQMAFRDQDNDIRLAFERLRKPLDALSVGYKDVFWSSLYPLTRTVGDKTGTIRFEFLDHARPPASTRLLFEGLPSLDASVAFDVIAAAPN
jgi:enamine deaminase RidA (YjgF/YER057c/UK114 family)